MANRARPKAKKPRGRPPGPRFLTNTALEEEIFKQEGIRIVIRDTQFRYRSYKEIYPEPLRSVFGTVREFFQRMAEMGVGPFVVIHYDDSFNITVSESVKYGRRGTPFSATDTVNSIRFPV